MENVLVTGGAGFIGSHLVERLVREGYNVKVLDNFSTGDKDNLRNVIDDIEILDIDIQNKVEVWNSMKGIDYIFHEAAMTSVEESVKNPAKCWKVNITGTLHVLNGAVKNNVKRVVLASSAAVYGTNMQLPKRENMDTSPVSPYGDSKTMNEINAKQFYKNNGLDCVCLRYFNVYGPRQSPNSSYSGVISKFIGRMSNDMQPIIYGDGKQTRDFIYVSDVVEANILAMKSKKAPGLTFNIGRGIQTSLLDLVSEINTIFEKSLVPHFRDSKKGDIKYSYSDISKAKEILDFNPNIILKEGLVKTVKWFNEPKD